MIAKFALFMRKMKLNSMSSTKTKMMQASIQTSRQVMYETRGTDLCTKAKEYSWIVPYPTCVQGEVERPHPVRYLNNIHIKINVFFNVLPKNNELNRNCVQK